MMERLSFSCQVKTPCSKRPITSSIVRIFWAESIQSTGLSYPMARSGRFSQAFAASSSSSKSPQAAIISAVCSSSSVFCEWLILRLHRARAGLVVRRAVATDNDAAPSNLAVNVEVGWRASVSGSYGRFAAGNSRRY